MRFWPYALEVCKRSLHWGWHAGHIAHGFMIFLSGLLIWLAVHLEHYPVAIALPFAVLVAFFLIGLFREAFLLYREEYERRIREADEHAKVADVLREEIGKLKKHLEQQTKEHDTEIETLKKEHGAASAGLRQKLEQATSDPCRLILARKTQSFLERLRPLERRLANKEYVRPDEVNGLTKEVDRYFQGTDEYRAVFSSCEDLDDSKLAILRNLETDQANLYRKVKKRIMRLEELPTP
jgi:hypothetical protein